MRFDIEKAELEDGKKPNRPCPDNQRIRGDGVRH
jgi:hypothetical protein